MKAIVILNQLVSHNMGQKTVFLETKETDIMAALADIYDQCANPEALTPKTFPSMSSGDLVIFPEIRTTYLCEPFGWKRLETCDLCELSVK